MDVMRQFGIFLGWEAVIVVIVVVNLTGAAKGAIDWLVGGEAARDARPWLRWVLKVLPPIVGALVAAVVPVRPAVIIEYAKDQDLSIWGMRAVYGGWGLVLGTFATTAYSRAKAFLRARTGIALRGTASVEPEEKP